MISRSVLFRWRKSVGARGTRWAQAVDGDREIWSVIEIFPNERNPTKLGTLQLDLSPPRLLGRFHKLKNCEWVRQGADFERCMVLFFLDLRTGEVHRTPVNGSFRFCGNPSIILTFMTKFDYMTTYICICVFIYIHMLFMYPLRFTRGGWVPKNFPGLASLVHTTIFI